MGESVTKTLFDTFNRLTHRIDPDGGVTVFAYDNLNRTRSVTYPDGGVYSVSAFTIHNQIQALHDPNGHTFTNAYDVMGRLTQRTITLPMGQPVTETFAYDAMGRMLRATDPDSGSRRPQPLRPPPPNPLYSPTKKVGIQLALNKLGLIFRPFRHSLPPTFGQRFVNPLSRVPHRSRISGISTPHPKPRIILFL
ncbi:MAG: hypothetical protein SFY68_02800 [Candidatus Sumerlaeia bacterium]|nr:hypothetical protein [Candidatus Sumerlaeia bacterium]